MEVILSHKMRNFETVATQTTKEEQGQRRRIIVTDLELEESESIWERNKKAHPMRAKALSDRVLSSRAIVMYLNFYDYAMQHDNTFAICIEEFAESSGCSTRTAQRSIKSLIERGYIALISRFHSEVNGKLVHEFRILRRN